ncbi:MAG: DUF3500 domain-containing protein [Gemmataceae bacterium]|nr:DUF3500 domain-containing protein [Gemmataceae bacterium]
MKLTKMMVAGMVLASVAGLALVAQQTAAPGGQMVTAAQKLLGALTEDQRKQATFAYDDKERTTWYFTPRQNNNTRKATRNGLPLEAMSPAQKKAALDLVRAGTSDSGNVAAVTIMSLEAILAELESPKGKMIRNPEWYFFTIFGTPAKTGKWGWRVEGHHLSLNFTLDGDQVIASSPAFFGANPAEIKGGPKKGHRTLAPAEDFARELFNALTNEQKQVARQPKHFAEPGETKPAPNVGQPVGLSAAKLNEAQRASLMKLLKSYTERMPPGVGAVEYKLVQQAKPSDVFVAYSGDPAPGNGYTYRVHGPTFVVEFLNTQADSAGNKANHIHSAWRRIKGDFGL